MLLKEVRPGIGLNKTQKTFLKEFIAEQQDPEDTDKSRR
jgi:hypothetical protein